MSSLSIICPKVSSYHRGVADSPEFTQKWVNRAVIAILTSPLLPGAQTYAGMRVFYDEKTSIIVASIITVCVAAIFTNKVAIDMSDKYRGGSCGGVPLTFLVFEAIAIWGAFEIVIAITGHANLNKSPEYAGLATCAGLGTMIIQAVTYTHNGKDLQKNNLGVSSQAKAPLLTLEGAQEV